MMGSHAPSAEVTTMRVALAGFLFVHGIAHLVGFVVPWRIFQAEEMPYSTTLLAGRMEVGDRGIRLVGLVWLGLTLAFFVAAAFVWMQRPGWPDMVILVAGASLVMSVLGLPAARLGVAINIVLLALLLGGRALNRW
jgi:hypothetical protein